MRYWWNEQGGKEKRKKGVEILLMLREKRVRRNRVKEKREGCEREVIWVSEWKLGVKNCEKKKERMICWEYYVVRYHRDIRLMSGCVVPWEREGLSEEKEG